MFELVNAFEACEITLNELREVLQPFSAETLQVVATFGAIGGALESGIPKFGPVQSVLSALASAYRSRC